MVQSRIVDGALVISAASTADLLIQKVVDGPLMSQRFQDLVKNSSTRIDDVIALLEDVYGYIFSLILTGTFDTDTWAPFRDISGTLPVRGFDTSHLRNYRKPDPAQLDSTDFMLRYQMNQISRLSGRSDLEIRPSHRRLTDYLKAQNLHDHNPKPFQKPMINWEPELVLLSKKIKITGIDGKVGSDLHIRESPSDFRSNQRVVPEKLDAVGLLAHGSYPVNEEDYLSVKELGLLPINVTGKVHRDGITLNPDVVSLSLSQDDNHHGSALTHYLPLFDGIAFVVDPVYVQENSREFVLKGDLFETDRHAFVQGLTLLGLKDHVVSRKEKGPDWRTVDEIQVKELPSRAIRAVIVSPAMRETVLRFEAVAAERGFTRWPIYVAHSTPEGSELQLKLYAPLVNQSSGSDSEHRLRDMKIEGPLPLVKAPNEQTVIEAFNRFIRDEAVSEADVEVMIQQAIFETRASQRYLRRISENVGLDIELLSGEACDLYCGTLDHDFRRRIHSLSNGRIEIISHLTNDVFESNEGHVFSVVRLKTGGNAYLVDLALRQYFRFQDEYETNQIGRSMNQRDRHVSDQILERGYISLDDHVANVYGNSFRTGGKEQSYFSNSHLNIAIQPSPLEHGTPHNFESFIPVIASKRADIDRKASVGRNNGSLKDIKPPRDFSSSGVNSLNTQSLWAHIKNEFSQPERIAARLLFFEQETALLLSQDSRYRTIEQPGVLSSNVIELLKKKTVGTAPVALLWIVLAQNFLWDYFNWKMARIASQDSAQKPKLWAHLLYELNFSLHVSALMVALESDLLHARPSSPGLETTQIRMTQVNAWLLQQKTLHPENKLLQIAPSYAQQRAIFTSPFFKETWSPTDDYYAPDDPRLLPATYERAAENFKNTPISISLDDQYLRLGKSVTRWPSPILEEMAPLDLMAVLDHLDNLYFFKMSRRISRSEAMARINETNELDMTSISILLPVVLRLAQDGVPLAQRAIGRCLLVAPQSLERFSPLFSNTIKVCFQMMDRDSIQQLGLRELFVHELIRTLITLHKPGQSWMTVLEAHLENNGRTVARDLQWKLSTYRGMQFRDARDFVEVRHSDAGGTADWVREFYYADKYDAAQYARKAPHLENWLLYSRVGSTLGLVVFLLVYFCGIADVGFGAIHAHEALASFQIASAALWAVFAVVHSPTVIERVIYPFIDWKYPGLAKKAGRSPPSPERTKQLNKNFTAALSITFINILLSLLPNWMPALQSTAVLVVYYGLLSSIGFFAVHWGMNKILGWKQGLAPVSEAILVKTATPPTNGKADMAREGFLRSFILEGERYEYWTQGGEAVVYINPEKTRIIKVFSKVQGCTRNVVQRFCQELIALKDKGCAIVAPTALVEFPDTFVISENLRFGVLFPFLDGPLLDNVLSSLAPLEQKRLIAEASSQVELVRRLTGGLEDTHGTREDPILALSNFKVQPDGRLIYFDPIKMTALVEQAYKDKVSDLVIRQSPSEDNLKPGTGLPPGNIFLNGLHFVEAVCEWVRVIPLDHKAWSERPAIKLAAMLWVGVEILAVGGFLGIFDSPLPASPLFVVGLFALDLFFAMAANAIRGSPEGRRFAFATLVTPLALGHTEPCPPARQVL